MYKVLLFKSISTCIKKGIMTEYLSWPHKANHNHICTDTHTSALQFYKHLRYKLAKKTIQKCLNVPGMTLLNGSLDTVLA